MNKLFFILLIGLVLIGFVSAGDDMKKYLAQTIYEDCQGHDIDVRPLGWHYTTTNESIPFLEWPNYDLNYLYQITSFIVDREPFSLTLSSGAEGITLLSCNGKNLAVNLYTYRWGGERVDPFSYNVQNFENYVDNRILQYANMNGSYKSQNYQCTNGNCTGGNYQYNLFSDNNFYITIAFSIGLSLISITFFELGLRFYKKRKKKTTKKKKGDKE
ncbi:hypothetical protein HN935_03005 [archaeon]|jgi:hypothetical protein|nr:hypothetical protein [archaeon]